MRKSNVIAWLTLLVAVLAAACGASAAPKTTAPRAGEATAVARSASQPAPFLWEIKRGTAVSHAFGTIHAGVRLEELPPVVLDRLTSSHTLVVETDTSGAAMEATMDLTMLPPEQSLRAMLGDEYWAVLLEHLGDSMAESALDRFRPWMIGVMITLGDLLKAGHISIDEALVHRARRADKQLVYLETVTEQLTLLDRVMDVDSLKETLDDVSRSRHVLHSLIRAYRTGNFVALAGIMLDPDDMARHPDRAELMLFARNRRWMKTLTPLLDRGGVFIAVGAGHYVGDDGLLELLGRAGYQIRRVDGATAK